MDNIYQDRKNAFNSFVSVNNTYPRHLHEHIEILCVLEGEIEATIENNTYVMTKGDIYMIFPNISHSLITKNKSLTHIIITSNIYYDDYANELKHYKPESPILHNRTYDKEIEYIFEKILEHKENARINKGYVNVLIGLLLEKMTLVKRDVNIENDILIKALNYVDNNFTKNITLIEMSKELGVNKYYLSHIFSQNLNCNFRSYINKRRVELAKHMLIDSDKTVMEIGLLCGYETARTFYRAFKKETNLTPKQYKNSF